MEDHKQGFARFLVEHEAFQVGDFTLRSGRRSPYFINTGVLSSGETIARLGEFYARTVEARHKSAFDLVFGPAYKGIPLAVSTAIAFRRLFDHDPGYAFDRKEDKDHGDRGRFIGLDPVDGRRVVIVDDVITSGSAVREAVQKVRSAGGRVLGVVVSVDRQERGQGEQSTRMELSEELGLEVTPIITVREIFDTLHGEAIDGRVVVDDATRERFRKYLETYGARSS